MNDGYRLHLEYLKKHPTGSQLLSKSPDCFAPYVWPSYGDAVGPVHIMGEDGKTYLDLSTSGIGCNPFGYLDVDIMDAVIQAMFKGSLTTLNCTEQIELTELLLDLHGWATMAVYGLTGKDACEIAIRIARTATGRDKVAIGGYHGCGDWYLAANLWEDHDFMDRHDALKNVLLPGLNAEGIPKGLAGTAHVFHHNNVEELNTLVDAHGDSLAAIIFEIQRGERPTPEFIWALWLAKKKTGAVLIVDEITSGFRKGTGGVHQYFDLKPDIAVFGKALGSGQPISAVIGKEEVMKEAARTFLSSTYWTWRPGFAAAIATIKKMQGNISNAMENNGILFQSIMSELAEVYGVECEIGHRDMAPLSHCWMPDDAMATLMTAEFVKRGILFGGDFYPTRAHTVEHMEEFRVKAERVFEVLAMAQEKGDAVDRLLGKVRNSRFERLAR